MEKTTINEHLENFCKICAAPTTSVAKERTNAVRSSRLITEVKINDTKFFVRDFHRVDLQFCSPKKQSKLKEDALRVSVTEFNDLAKLFFENPTTENREHLESVVITDPSSKVVWKAKAIHSPESVPESMIISTIIDALIATEHFNNCDEAAKLGLFGFVSQRPSGGRKSTVSPSGLLYAAGHNAKHEFDDAATEKKALESVLYVIGAIKKLEEITNSKIELI